MELYGLLITLLMALCMGVAERQELIMLEIQPIIYEKTIVKRSPATQFGQEQQYLGQPASEAVPPEYYSFLQQLQSQQSGVPQQPDPNNLQQALVSRTPQRFIGQPPPRPPPRRLTPEQEQQRRLQENIAQKSIREQEIKDAQRQQQLQFQQLYQGAQIDPAYLSQLQQAQQQYIQLPEARQYVQVPQQQQQYVQVPSQQRQQYVQAPQQQQQYVQVPSQQRQQYVQAPPPQAVQAEPERVSYSQVQFGSTKLPRRLTKLLPQSVQPVQSSAYVQPQPQQIVYTQPQQQQTLIQPKVQQQLVYAPQPQEVVYTQQNDIYQQPARSTPAEIKSSDLPASLPQQYLIETTKVEPAQHQRVVTIPKPKAQQIYYRPQASYQDLDGNLLAQQQQLQYAQQQQEATTVASSPSRSSIFVSSARSHELNAALQKSAIPELRLPKQDGQRPLSQNELNALINAGFKVTPSPSVGQEYSAYQPQYSYYKEIGKRQNKPIPRPVQLSTEERRALEKEGIRNLYRVETAESSDSPVTYVLALSTPPKQ